jgi:hypothetical protein
MSSSRLMLRATMVTLLATSALVTAAVAQFEVPRPSPKASVSQVVGFTDVSIAYCRPGVKGRVIWGGLVPYDQVWRTGANEATTITFSTDVTVDGKPLPAGTYGLFTIPGKDEWTVIFNKGAKLWGAYEYKQEDDVLRINVKPQQAPFTERMTFAFPNTTTETTEVALTWERLTVSFTVKVEVINKVLADARKAVAEAKPDDWRTPQRAAGFCADNNVNFDEALTWADRSIAIAPGYYNHFIKARLLAATGKKAEAIALVKKAIELGTKAEPKADTAPAERALAEWSAQP